MKAGARLLGGSLLVATWLAIGACRTPTQVTIVVKTNLRCADLTSGISIAVAGAPDVSERNVALHFASGTTKACSDDGEIGTLVITPGGDRAAVVVTAGYGGQDTAKCTPENDFKNCIVARRSFAFVEHTRLTLPIELSADCVNVPCGTLSTCKAGACVEAAVDCTEDGCTEPGGGGGPGPDGGPMGDGAPGDGPDGSDATTDAPPDGSTGGALTSDPQCGAVQGGPMAYRQYGQNFCVDRTEVTQAQYAAFMAKSLPKMNLGCGKVDLAPALSATVQPPCFAMSYTPAVTPELPVVCVDHCDATTYCASVGKILCPLMRWQEACRAGVPGTAYPYGDTYESKRCNDMPTGLTTPVPVASLPGCTNASAETKVFDMSGNVWEWVEGSVRGGGFKASQNELACSQFMNLPLYEFTAEIGFRCCKLVP